MNLSKRKKIIVWSVTLFTLAFFLAGYFLLTGDRTNIKYQDYYTPYDDGWTVTVDGVKQPLKKSLDAFLRVDVTAGEHEVELNFFPKYLREGIIISLVSLGILCILIFISAKRKKGTVKR